MYVCLYVCVDVCVYVRMYAHVYMETDIYLCKYITKFKVGSHTYLNFDTFTRCAKHHIMILFLTSLDDHVYATDYYYLLLSLIRKKNCTSTYNFFLDLMPCFKLEN